MNNIYCEDPKVIWHPHASKLIQKYRTFTMPSGVYHGSVLHVNKNHVNKNNIDKYTIVNPATGETFPMFLIVPCNNSHIIVIKMSSTLKTGNFRITTNSIHYIFNRSLGKITGICSTRSVNQSNSIRIISSK